MAVVVAVLLATYAIVLTVSRDFRQMTGRGIMVVFSGGLRAGPGGPELQRRDGRLYLRAGRAPEEEFDITAFRLETNQLHYGSSRERIPALTDPQYITVAEADRWIDADARVLLVGIGEDVRVYPLSFLRSNELVNDVVGGRPIVVAYCYLADLGAVYDRRAGGRTLTFALSSYTYADPDVWDGRRVRADDRHAVDAGRAGAVGPDDLGPSQGRVAGRARDPAPAAAGAAGRVAP